MAEGSTAGLGTCWTQQALPLAARLAEYDEAVKNPGARSCLVTDWLPPTLVWVDGGSADTGASGTRSLVGGIDQDASRANGDTSAPVGLGPGPGPGAMLDPATVYAALSTTTDGHSELRLYDPRDTSKSWRALPEGFMRGVVRPSDGALIYIRYFDASVTVGIFQFVPDKTPVGDPGANDRSYVLPSCAHEPLLRMWVGVAPDTGDILTKCDSTYTYLASGASFKTGGLSVQAIGNGGRHLLGGVADHNHYIDSLDGSDVTVAPGPRDHIAAARSTPTGFWLLDVTSDTGQLDRWHVLYDGSTSEHVTYPPSPLPLNGALDFWDFSLDGLGRAVVVMTDSPASTDHRVVDAIVRFDPSAVAGEVLLELKTLNDSRVRKTILVTGP